ncbi:E3 ubiquitin-protein ligase RNF31-like isoform X5 [Lates japonicus]|uniref:E3 ubiquitin-protein ligase RNF31-like isoform X5 n=1 Tax=Lates japonicus TaxID=270547 RepID=A0AAD3M887_LATJO|nr:E3 ubiquitin-protein ligase RNF31-like isoform X5 [Lates japonicus]
MTGVTAGARAAANQAPAQPCVHPPTASSDRRKEVKHMVSGQQVQTGVSHRHQCQYSYPAETLSDLHKVFQTKRRRGWLFGWDGSCSLSEGSESIISCVHLASRRRTQCPALLLRLSVPRGSMVINPPCLPRTLFRNISATTFSISSLYRAVISSHLLLMPGQKASQWEEQGGEGEEVAQRSCWDHLCSSPPPPSSNHYNLFLSSSSQVSPKPQQNDGGSEPGIKQWTSRMTPPARIGPIRSSQRQTDRVLDQHLNHQDQDGSPPSPRPGGPSSCHHDEGGLQPQDVSWRQSNQQRSPISPQIITMTHCSCFLCQTCFKTFFSAAIKERSIDQLVCPQCGRPEVRGEGRMEESMDYFNLLDTQIRHFLPAQLHELFQRKLRDRALQEMPNFCWCAHCSFGMLHEADRLRMDCPSCKKSTCSQCRSPWSPQHQGLWFPLPIRNQSSCPPPCRDCLYHLRDWSVTRLHLLLQFYRVSPSWLEPAKGSSPDTSKTGVCLVLELRDDGSRREEPCGQPALPEYRGYCQLHYKERLVELINRCRADPAVLFSPAEMMVELQRWHVAAPTRKPDESEQLYTQRLRLTLTNRVPLRKQRHSLLKLNDDLCPLTSAVAAGAPPPHLLLTD